MGDALPHAVKMVEVGPRDGLQNEKQTVPLSAKVALIDALSDSGLKYIEAGSFVSPKWVPQMADSDQVLAQIARREGVSYAALVPNTTGLQRALDSGVSEVAVFAAASEAFSQKNINCTIAESLKRFEPVMALATQRGIPVRGYVSCVLGCPYQGQVSVEAVRDVASQLIAMGCYEVSLGDTIGVGTPHSTLMMLDTVLEAVPVGRLAVHFHDTYGQALANIYAALQRGIATVDSSVAGLGGCPYAKGASGNVASEDVLYLLNGLGIETGVDLAKLIHAGNAISTSLGRVSLSKVAVAMSQD